MMILFKPGTQKMKYLLPLFALSPALIFGKYEYKASTSINHIERKDAVGKFWGDVAGIHLEGNEDTGLGFKVDMMALKDKSNHFLYTNSEISYQVYDNSTVVISPSISWKNIWRGCDPVIFLGWLPYKDQYISARSGAAFAGANFMFPFHKYINVSLHPQVFCETIASKFLKSEDSWRTWHYPRFVGARIATHIEGDIWEALKYGASFTYEKALKGPTNELLYTVKLSYQF